MLAALGEYVFEMNQTAYQETVERIRVNWARHRRVEGYLHHVAVGKSEESIELTGKIILKNITALDELKDLVRQQKPVVLAFGNGYAYWVILNDLEIESSRFLKSGEALKREFSVNLERYYFGS